LERSLWTRLDLSPAGGVAEERVTEALFRGAAAKARGGLTALDVSECFRLADEVLLEVPAANAGALTELRACCGWMSVLSAEQVAELLAAAPLLRVCHTDVREAAPAVACRMLRNEPPFGPLLLHMLWVAAPWPGGEPDVRALAADVTASASPLSQLMLSGAPLAERGALDAVVDAALARRLPGLTLFHCRLSAASLPALARLLGGNALTSLVVQSTEPLLLPGAEGSAALLAAALRANNTLTMLVTGITVWHDAAAAETLLHALTAHPSLRCLQLDHNDVRTAGRARAGAAFGALIAANAPALTELNVADCFLGDEGLGPLVDALASNTHLRELDCARNGLSDAFGLHRLLPAVRANASLRRLTLRRGEGDDLRFIERMVAERA
jgi:hypothetical protein